jgi:hypothetical protein
VSEQQRALEATIEQQAEAVERIADPVQRVKAAQELLHEIDAFQAALRREAGIPRARPQQRARAERIEGITFRCRPCSRSLGHHAPALAILERVEGPRRWAVHKVLTWGQGLGDSEEGRRTGGRIIRDVFSPDGAWNTARGIELECRCCPHKPRKAARDLYALADEAVDKGRQDVFV